MFKKILKIFAWLILGFFLIFTLAFTSSEVKDVKCEEIEVLFDGLQVISINKEEIINLVKKADNKVFGKNIRQINSEVIESAVEKHKTILNAEVYKVIVLDDNKYKGVLAVRVNHRKPILRIMSSKGDYFLDKNKVQIPVSTQYAANVLVATGDISKEFAVNQLLPVVRFIKNNQFLKAQIEQVHVSRNKELIFTPLVGSHLIDFGTVENYQNKFKNLEIFYARVLAQNNWNKYKRISLKYKDQIIGIKR